MKKISTLVAAALLSTSLFAQSRALNFDGIDDFLHIPEKTNVLTGSSMTFEAWVKPAGFSHFASVINKGSDGNYFSVTFHYDEMMAEMGMDVDPYINIFLSNGSANGQIFHYINSGWINQWHHLAVTYNGSQIVFYVDGNIAGTTAFSGDIPFNAGYLRIGTSYVDYLNFAGSIDEVRIWNTVRNQAQIQAVMNTEISPASTGLVAYYKMNDGTINGNNTGINTVADWVHSSGNASMMNFAKTGSASNFTNGYTTLQLLASNDLSFTATKKDEAVQLDWKIQSALSSSKYDIERSANGNDFVAIGTVNGRASGTELSYSFTDKQPGSNLNYYRIKSTIATGQITYSKIVTVKMEKTSGGLQAYPTLVQNTVNVQFTATAGMVTLQVKDLNGRTVQLQKVQSNGTTLYTSIDVSQLPKGNYIILAGKESARFIKQ